MSEYVPTTPEVDGIRSGWACSHVREDITLEVAYAAFDSWLAETIRQARDEAWDEGYRASDVAWVHAYSGHPVLEEEMCSGCRPSNPYAEEATDDHHA